MTLSLEDHEEIRQLMARAAYAVDFGHPDDLAALFTPDGSFRSRGLPETVAHSGVQSGRDGIRALVNSVFGGTQGHCRHWNLNHIVTADSGDQAELVSYLAVIRVGMTPASGVIMTALLFDTVKKIDGRWLLHERVCSIDPQPEHQGAPDDTLVTARDAWIASLS